MTPLLDNVRNLSTVDAAEMETDLQPSTNVKCDVQVVTLMNNVIIISNYKIEEIFFTTN